MAANTTPSTQDLRSFLHLLNGHYKISLANATIENAAIDVRAQGINTVNEFLQPHIMPCLVGLMPPALANAVSTYFNAMTKSQAPKLPPLSTVPPAPAPKPTLKPPPGLAPPPGLKPSSNGPVVPPQQQQQPKAINNAPVAVAVKPLPAQVTPTPQTVLLQQQHQQPQQQQQQQQQQHTSFAVTTTSSTTVVTSGVPTKLPFAHFSAKTKGISAEKMYLPGKYQRKTTCRFCCEELVIGVNDYTTLLVRTTKIYSLLVHHANIHSSSHQVSNNGLPHRQPQIPYILDSSHPLPLPLPSHLANVCDGGKLIAMEHKLSAMISAILAKRKSPQDDIQEHYIEPMTGFVNLDALSALLSSAATPVNHLLDLFEDPPYDLTPLPQHDFLQGTASGEDPSGMSHIPQCLRRMTNTCTRLLPCGCPCNGLRGELASDCPPCPYHEMTADEIATCGDECVICADDLLKQGPTFVSGSYQHIMPRPGLRKQADVAFPVQEYLISLGLNGHFVDYSQTNKTSGAPPFEIDNHHPNNFLSTDKNGSLSNILEYQPAGGHQLVAKQTWSHNSLPPALAFLNENNVCKHAHHLDCFMERLNTNWETGKRINFNYLRCHICTLYVFHPLLVPFLVHHYAMEQYVTAKAIQRLEYDGELKNDDIMSPESEFFQDPVGYALKQYVFYLCSTCQKPYFGGTADCQMDNGEGSNGQLVCLTCCPTLGKTCEHSEEFMVHKCKFCCKHSTYICWSNTWFCDDCHVPSIWPTLVYSRSGKNKLNIEQYLQCPSLERQIKALQASPEYQNSKSSQLEQLQRLRCDPKECPLRVAHPPNGFNFVIGCKQCETEGLTEGINYIDSSDDENDGSRNQPERIVLQGIKQKRIKAKRIKGPRMRAIAKGPSPYIVPFFDMESRTFNQLSLYSYLYLYRVLYDKHYILPQSQIYDAYLRYNQQQLSQSSPLLKDLLNASQLVDKIHFIDLLPFTPIREDNFNKIPTSSLLSQASAPSALSSLPSLAQSPSTTTTTTTTTSSSLSSSPTTAVNANISGNEYFQQCANVPNAEAVKTNKRISFHFSPSYLLDHNGFFYFLGTLGHTQPYLNPHKRGLIQCSSSADQADFTTLPPWGFIERADVRHVSEDKVGASYTVDLKLIRLAPTHYTLKHYTTRPDGCIRSWVLEGFSNGSWYTLDQRDHDYALNGRDSCAIFRCDQSFDFLTPSGYGRSSSSNHTATNNSSNSSKQLQQKRYFTQFRLRQTSVNSLRKDFLAVTGFELYGEVEFPTVHELLLPATKHYSDSALKWSQKIPREKIPEASTALTSTTLIPNTLRFVLDNGIRYLNLSNNVFSTVQTLFQEEALRHYKNASAKDPSAKIRTFSIPSTNFLPIQLPTNIQSPHKQTFILTRNVTHNQYHNNRLDISWCISYNEPLLLAMISTLNSVFSSAPTPLNLGKTLEPGVEQTYIANINSRANWSLLTQFAGAIVPTLKFIQDHYNLPNDQFQRYFNENIVANLKSTSEQDKFNKAEMLHQQNRQKEDDERVAQAKLAEEDAARQRKLMRDEEERIAKLHNEHAAAAAAASPATTPPSSSNPSPTQYGAAAVAIDGGKASSAVSPPERAHQQSTSNKPQDPTATTTTTKKQPQLDDFTPQQHEDIAMVHAGLGASPHRPLLLYKTPTVDGYLSYITQLNRGPVSSVSNGINSGGIFYYLGTLNHTDITNLNAIQQELATSTTNNNSQGKKTEKADVSLRPVFHFTNPQQLGAVALTASSYPYQRAPLYNIVDSLAKFKSDPSSNPQRSVHITPNPSITFNTDTTPLSANSTLVASLNSAWVQFDFGAYRVNVNGYSLNFGNIPTNHLMTDWLLEGSNGYSAPTSLELEKDHSLSTERTFAWSWTPIVTHIDDNTHRYSTTGLYHVAFNTPTEDPDKVKISPEVQKALNNNATKESDHEPLPPFTFRYLRLRSLRPQQPLILSGIEFFGSVYTTVPFPTTEALEFSPGIDPPSAPTTPTGSAPASTTATTTTTIGGKAQNDLIRNGRKLAICDLVNRRYLQHHAQLQLFFKSGLFRHTRQFLEANGGPSNGSGFTPDLVRQYIQHYGLPVLQQQYAVETVSLLNGQPSQFSCLLPQSFSTLFEYFRYLPNNERFSCYSSGLPGLNVNTFKQSAEFMTPFIFQQLNSNAVHTHLAHFNRFSRPTNSYTGHDAASGNPFYQLESICKHFRSTVNPAAFSDQDLETITAPIVSAPFSTAGHTHRFSTAVYTSSTHSKPFLFGKQPPTLAFAPPEPLTRTQFTIPTVLTTALSTPQNNIAWASSQSAKHNTSPYVIVDMGPFQRIQLSGYSLGLYATPDQALYPRNFQVFGSINAADWYIISNHSNDESLSAQTPVATWGAATQTIGETPDPAQGIVSIPVQDTMTSYGVPLYFPAYRFFCFISTGVNSGGQDNRLMLSKIDFTGLLVSSSVPLSTLPFPYDPFRYSSCRPPQPL